MSKKKKKLKTPEIPTKVDLNVLCDLIVVTDAYRSGHRIDYSKLKDAIREGKLGTNFEKKEWPIIRTAILKADEARGSLADWKDEESNRIRKRKRTSLSLGYLLLPIGIVLSVIPLVLGIPIDFLLALTFLLIGAAFLVAGYVYYPIKLSEHIDTIFMAELDEGKRTSKNLKELTQELINSLRNALKSRLDRGIYTEVREVELELYNVDYDYVRFRGITSRVKRLKKVYVVVE
jgi:uncharacterized membrane protein YkvA (DUF1232 family)